MIKEAYERRDDDKFWDKQLLIDYWIHERMEQF